MAYTKIIDVRFTYAKGKPPQIAFRFFPTGQGANIPGGTSPLTLASMVMVFDVRSEWYWDDKSSTFTTDPTVVDWSESVGDVKIGAVAAWDVMIPAKGNARFRLALQTDNEKSLVTSGKAASGSVTIEVTPDELPIVLALLASRVCLYDNGTLRDSQID